MFRKGRASHSTQFSALVLATAATIPALRAVGQPVEGTWKGDFGVWSDPLKWIGGVPGASPRDDVAHFLAGNVVDNNLLLSDPRTLGTLHFDSPHPYLLGSYKSGGLSFDSSSGTAQILVTTVNGAASHLVGVPIQLLSPLRVTVAVGAELHFDHSIGDNGGGQGITFDGPGTTRLDGVIDNTYTGSTTVNSGTLEIATSVRAIPGRLVIGNGSAPANVHFYTLGGIAPDADVLMHSGPGGSANLQIANQTIGSLSGNGNITGTTLKITGDRSTTFSGTFNFGDLYKSGPSAFTLSGANKFAAVYLDGGAIVLGSDTAIDNATLYLNNFNRNSGDTTLRATSPRLLGNQVYAQGYVSFDGDASMTFGVMNLRGDTEFNVSADTAFATVGSQYGSYRLTKSGPGTLTIGTPGKPNLYLGPTIINEGTLRLANGGIGDQTSTYVVNHGTLDFTALGTNVALRQSVTGNSGTVLGNLTVNSYISGTNLTLGDLTVSSGNPNALVGTLVTGNITYAKSSPPQTIAPVTRISGPGTVNVAATLTVNGRVDKSFRVTAPLWGKGTIAGAVDVYRVDNSATGILGAGSPGVPSGTFTVGDLNLEAGATLEAGIGGSRASTINVVGTVDLAGAFLLITQGAPDLGTPFVILQNDGFDAVRGGFSNLPHDGDGLIARAGGVDYLYTIDYHYDATGDGANNDIALTATAAATPEPAGFAVLGLGALLLSRRGRRR